MTFRYVRAHGRAGEFVDAAFQLLEVNRVRREARPVKWSASSPAQAQVPAIARLVVRPGSLLDREIVSGSREVDVDHLLPTLSRDYGIAQAWIDIDHMELDAEDFGGTINPAGD